MSEDLKFKFYEATSNEDAGPYLSDTRMIVCDGCGGAGGFYHHVDPDLIDSFEKVKALILPDEHDESSDEFIKEFFAPVYNEPEKDRTSAFWASRIVLSNFIFCFSDDDSDELKAKEQAINGLKDVADKLKFEPPLIGSKTLLPTTFVEVNLSYLGTNNPSADIFWAGDSRAYIYNEEGLKQLTIDDEDETGAITNLFCCRDDIETKLHYFKKDFKNKCIIFVCSDGLFDNYSDLDFEYILSGFMQESNSIEEYRSKLVEFYNKRKSDDCTMAFNAIGFEGYAEMKAFFAPRATYVANLWKQYQSFLDCISLKDNPTIYDDYLQKIVVRTNDKSHDILNTIGEEYKRNGKCNLIDDALLEEVAKSNTAKKEKAIENFNEIKKGFLKELRECIIMSLNETPLREIFDFEKAKGYQLAILKKIEGTQNFIVRASIRSKQFEEDEQKYEALCDDFLTNIARLLAVLDKADIVKVAIVKEGMDAFTKKIRSGKYHMKEIAPLLSMVAAFMNRPEFETEFRMFDHYHERKEHHLADQKAIEEKFPQIVKSIKELFENADDVYPIISRSSSNEIIRNLIMRIDDAENKVKELSGDVKAEDIINYLAEIGAEALVERRLKLGKEVTCIDRFYNTYLLNNLIKYYQARNVPSEEFDEFYQNYLAFSQNAISLFEEIDNSKKDY